MTVPSTDTPPADGGATPPAAEPPTTGPPAEPAADVPLGPPGQKALAEERAARQALEKRVAALAPLEKLAQSLAGGEPTPGKSEVDLLTERLAGHEEQLAAERSARWRAEVAATAGLTPEQAARLVGTTREELEADAQALRTLFPATPAGPRVPVPDPSQSAGRDAAPPDIDAQIAEAQKAKDWRKVISLQNSKLANHKP